MDKDFVVKTLEKLLDEDTNIRNLYLTTKDSKYLQDMKKMDIKTTEFVKKLITDFGFPTISRVGNRAAFHAWKLVQHSEDKMFQEKYLQLMEENIHDVNKRDLAYLKDRVLLGKGEQQIYGTQFIKTENGKYIPTNLWNPESVNERRKEMQLDTLEENAYRMLKLYG